MTKKKITMTKVQQQVKKSGKSSMANSLHFNSQKKSALQKKVEWESLIFKLTMKLFYSNIYTISSTKVNCHRWN